MGHPSMGLKRSLWLLAAVLWGSALGFFGVFVSVFADGGLTERLITVAVILGIYCLSAGLLTYVNPVWSWQWTFPLNTPALLILLIYAGSEPALSGSFALYAVLIAAATILGAIVVRRLKGTPMQ